MLAPVLWVSTGLVESNEPSWRSVVVRDVNALKNTRVRYQFAPQAGRLKSVLVEIIFEHVDPLSIRKD